MGADAMWDADGKAWAAARAKYPARIEAFGDAELVTLDRWRTGELPGAVRARTPAHATREELVKLTRWKMKRGVWRQPNLVRVQGNPPAEVVRLTGEALAAMPDPRKPIALIAELDGVGPATASALVSAMAPETYPFFDEVVAEQIPALGKVAFTIPYYLRYAEALRGKAKALGPAWTAEAVAEALFAIAPPKE